MWQTTVLPEYPEGEPEIVFTGLPAGPRARRGVGIRKAGLRNITITEASFDTSASLTPAPGVGTLSFPGSPSTAYIERFGFLQKRKSNLNSLSLPLSAVVGSAISKVSHRPDALLT